MSSSKTASRRRKRLALFEAQKGVCCWDGSGCLYPGESMLRPPEGQQSKGKRQHRLSASFEHVKRRREGGTHGNGNVRLAHYGCNQARERAKHADRFVSHETQPSSSKGEQPDGPVHEA